MIGSDLRYRALIAVIVLFLPAGEALAQSVRVASFVSASQIAADPNGNLYVIDRGAGTLVRIGSDGRRESVGGRGGTLAMPTAVDPTNGLRIYVVDGSTSEIYRLSRALALIDVHRLESSTGGHRHSRDGDRLTPRAHSDIVAIGSTRVGNIVVLDRRERRIDIYDMRWRHLGEIETFGPESRGFDDPVGLCVDRDDAITVFDRGANSLLMFDAFGSFKSKRTLPVPDVRAMSCDRESVRVHSRSSAHVRSEEGWQSIEFPQDIQAAVIGSVAMEDNVYWLTERALYRTSSLPNPDGR